MMKNTPARESQLLYYINTTSSVLQQPDSAGATAALQHKCRAHQLNWTCQAITKAHTNLHLSALDSKFDGDVSLVLTKMQPQELHCAQHNHPTPTNTLK